jgi:hypothetical protein
MLRFFVGGQFLQYDLQEGRMLRGQFQHDVGVQLAMHAIKAVLWLRVCIWLPCTRCGRAGLLYVNMLCSQQLAVAFNACRHFA